MTTVIETLKVSTREAVVRVTKVVYYYYAHSRLALENIMSDYDDEPKECVCVKTGLGNHYTHTTSAISIRFCEMLWKTPKVQTSRW